MRRRWHWLQVVAVACATERRDAWTSIAAAVASFNEDAAARVPAPRVRSAVVLSGYLRTGVFEDVVANWRRLILEPLGGCDLFWPVAEAEATAAVVVKKTLRALRGSVAHATVAVADEARFKRLERNCSGTVDATANGAKLRNCLPLRAQFFGLGVAFSRVAARETMLGATYEWVLKIRGDMIHARPLPPVETWNDAPRAVYLDERSWQEPCSKGRSPCRCLCVGDRFIIAPRALAPTVFGVADRALADDGCASISRCPRTFRGAAAAGGGGDQAACYPAAETRLFPECLLGAALLTAGLDDAQIKLGPVGTLLSCGPDPDEAAGADAGDDRHRAGDDAAGDCAAAYWRSPANRLELAESLRDRPIPPPRPPKPFW